MFSTPTVNVVRERLMSNFPSIRVRNSLSKSLSHQACLLVYAHRASLYSVAMGDTTNLPAIVPVLAVLFTILSTFVSKMRLRCKSMCFNK